MKKLRNIRLRRFIRNEVKKLVDEDSLHPSPTLGEPHYVDNDELDDEVYCPTCDTDHPEASCPSEDPNFSIPGNEISRLDMIINESCGCQQKQPLVKYYDEEGMDDYSLDSIGMQGKALGSLFDMGSKNVDNELNKPEKHHRSSYMARPQLSKIAKYANKLLSMIGEEEEIQDWQESHIAQMADDISEVFHSIEYKQHKD